MEHLGNKNFVLSLSMFFSDPECPLVFSVCEMLKEDRGLWNHLIDILKNLYFH